MSEDTETKKQKKADEEDKKIQEALDKADEATEKTNTAAERLEKANEEHKTLLDREVQLKIDTALGGEADAGDQEQTEEEKEIAGARELIKDSGYEDMFDPPKKKEQK